MIKKNWILMKKIEKKIKLLNDKKKQANKISFL